MKKFVFLAAFLVAAVWNLIPALAQNEGNKPSLYVRLGGYDALAAVTDDLIGRLAGDPKIGPFLRGLSDGSKIKLRQNFVDFLCQATGGPCYYVGKDMKAAHQGLHITNDEWESAVADTVATLNKFNVPVAEKTEVLAMISSLKKDIVESNQAK